MIRGFRSGSSIMCWRFAQSGPHGFRVRRVHPLLRGERHMFISMMPSSWPAVIVGLIIGIYWLKVLQLVARTKRTVGRAANFVPPEPLGRLLRFIWIPVVLLWIFLPLITPFIVGLPQWLLPVRYSGDVVVAWLAVVIAVIAFAITWVCWLKMGTS